MNDSIPKLVKQLNNGCKIPVIGFGTFPYKEPLMNCLPKAIESNGVSLIDTSDNYQNEVYVGKGLVQVDLSNVTVISKFSQPLRTNEVEKCFEESMNNLGAINI